MRKRSQRFVDPRADQRLAVHYPTLLQACRARGMRVLRDASGQPTRDFSPAELVLIRAKVLGYLAAGTCRVSSGSEPPLETL